MSEIRNENSVCNFSIPDNTSHCEVTATVTAAIKKFNDIRDASYACDAHHIFRNIEAADADPELKNLYDSLVLALPSSPSMKDDWLDLLLSHIIHPTHISAEEFLATLHRFAQVFSKNGVIEKIEKTFQKIR